MMTDKQMLTNVFDRIGVEYSERVNEIEVNDGYDEDIILFTFDEYGKFYETK